MNHDDSPPHGLSTRDLPLPKAGHLAWIGIRPDRNQPMVALNQARLLAGRGISGDHFPSRPGGKRQITLLQAEHLAVIAALVGLPRVAPETLRRNLLVSGINLLALKGRRFLIGETLLEGTTACAPCRKMEAALGPGGYQAMRGHGGICARILTGGTLQLGDPVRALDPAP